ncbi:hypothetical protein BU15DRAFT_81566 [Melanogaster broomeanus]|nr:hypothetical protein BU15DRAFT_81566 [Melanogaster broomeanus]
MSSSPKVWFVTGSSSGFGRSMVELLLQQGRSRLSLPFVTQMPSQILPPNTLLPNSVVVKLDVTQSSDVPAAFEKARQAFGKIDVVFNNAGVFEVNFWGCGKRHQGGRTVLPRPGGPSAGFYSASKFALEGLSECLSTELDPAWNIKVTIIEPGPFRTKDHPKSPSSQMRAYFASESGAVDGDADKAVVAMEKLVHLDNPPLRLPLHKWTVAAIKEKIQKVLEEVQAYESWSDDLYIN